MSAITQINPVDVHPDGAGSRTRNWFIRMPKDMKADGLNDPKAWKAVQLRRDKQLARHDRLYCVAYDESFAVEARVTDAGPEAVVIAPLKVIKFPERMTPLFNDGRYKVQWSGVGYVVVRIEDDVQMGAEFGSEALAIRHIQSLYPRPAAR